VPISHRFGAVTSLVALVLAAGCTARSSGSPQPQPSSGSATTATSDDEPLLARPRDIGLGGTNPCELWTAGQLAELGLSTSPRGGVTSTGDNICHFDAQDQQPPYLVLSVSTIPDHDTKDFYLPHRGHTIVDIAGFPAVRQQSEIGSPTPCQVYVSTAPGQTLEISLHYSSTKNHLTIEQACELTVKAATLAMQTLQKQR